MSLDVSDKRFAVYRAVEQLVTHALRENGKINLNGDEFRRFKDAQEEAKTAL